MQFKNPMGIDPIVHPLIGYVPTPTDKLNFLSQIETMKKNIDKYWPEDNSWDEYEQATENEENVQIKFETISEHKKTLSEKYNVNKISDEYDIVLTKVK